MQDLKSSSKYILKKHSINGYIATIKKLINKQDKGTKDMKCFC